MFDETPEESGHPDETPNTRVVLGRGKFSDSLQVGVTRLHTGRRDLVAQEGDFLLEEMAF